MATGDQNDIVSRLKTVLPSGWFPLSGAGQTSPTPILDGVLGGKGGVFSWLYSLIQYVKLQCRIITSTDAWLDMAAWDFFGPNLTRRSGETDPKFAARVVASLPPEGATRQAVIDVLKRLTGYAPIITELWVPGDTGAYDKLGGYDTFGAYSAPTPYQAFVTIIRKYTGLPWVAGYDSPLGAYDKTGGGSMWASLDMAPGYVSDDVVFSALRAIHVYGTIIWAKFQMTVLPNVAPVPPLPPSPKPAYVGGYGPITSGGVTFALNAYSIPSASAYS